MPALVGVYGSGYDEKKEEKMLEYKFDTQPVSYTHLDVYKRQVKGREDILKVHAKGKPLAPEVDLAVLAKRTPGMGLSLIHISSLCIRQFQRRQLPLPKIVQVLFS